MYHKNKNNIEDDIEYMALLDRKTVIQRPKLASRKMYNTKDESNLHECVKSIGQSRSASKVRSDH